MTRTAVMACVLAAAAGAAQASTVEFRIVERRGQTTWNPFTAQTVPGNDNILNFAVQGRVVGGAAGEALGNFGFDITSNEATANGSLSRARISVAGTGAYDTSGAQYNANSTVGTGGLAGTYTYLAGINPNFNGLINSSGGSFTNNPAINQIGLVTGSPTGGSLLLTFGAAGNVDGGGNPVPDSWTSGDSAPLDASLADQYLGADGNFRDLFHFNYTVSATSSRTITFSLANAQAQTFAGLALANGVWGPDNPLNAMGVTVAGASVVVTPAPASVALLGLGGLVAARRRRTA